MAALYGTRTLAGGLLLALALLAAPAAAAAPPTVRTQEMRDEQPGWRIDLRYPVLAGPGAEAFNTQIDDLLRQMVEGFREEAASQAMRADNASGLLKADYRMGLVTPRLASVAFTVTDRAPGTVKDLTLTLSVHVDLRTGRPVGPADVFTPGSNWAKTLGFQALTDLRRQARERNATLLEEAPQTVADAVADLSNWRFEAERAVIVFDPELIAPAPAGRFEVALPYATLKPFLRPDGPLPPQP